MPRHQASFRKHHKCDESLHAVVTTPPHWVVSAGQIKLALAARPRGDGLLVQNLQDWKDQGVERVVSLLPQAEAMGLGLSDEQRACEQVGLQFNSWPIVDMQTPGGDAMANTHADSFIQEIALALTLGQAVAVHCRAGIGRTGLVSASLLVCLGWSAEQAMSILGQARGHLVPETPEQVRWVEAFAERQGQAPG